MRIPGETLSLGHVLQRQSSVDTLSWGQALSGKHSTSDKFFHVNALPWGTLSRELAGAKIFFPLLPTPHPPTAALAHVWSLFHSKAVQFFHLPLLENSVPSLPSKEVPPRDDMSAPLKPHYAGSSLSPGYVPGETSLMKSSPEEATHLAERNGRAHCPQRTGFSCTCRSTANPSTTQKPFVKGEDTRGLPSGPWVLTSHTGPPNDPHKAGSHKRSLAF